MKNFTAKRITLIAAVAAIYFVLTIAISPLAFGPIQFRFSEILVLLCFYNKDYCYSMAAGCALANLFSPMAALDVPFGTAATIITVICIYKSSNLWIAAIFPVISNGIIIALELKVALNAPLLLSMGTVAFGELVVVLILGVPIFKLLEKNKAFMKLISMEGAIKAQ